MIAGYYDSKAFSNSQRKKIKKKTKKNRRKKRQEAAVGPYGRYSLDAARYPPVSGMIGEPFMKPETDKVIPEDDESPLLGGDEEEDAKLHTKRVHHKSSFAQSLFNAVNV